MNKNFANGMTVAQFLHYAGSKIRQLDAELLLAQVLQCSRVRLFAYPEYWLTSQLCDIAWKLIMRRLAGEPVAYIVGHKEFWNLDLEVNYTTIIPRPDTEKIVEMALELKNIKQVLDLGTGTGNIALSLAKERPSWSITGVEIRDDALQLAKKNAKKHDQYNVDFCQSSWFTNLYKKFNLIVGNPPYIAQNDHCLTDLCFEPQSALVSGVDGLNDLRLIIEQAPVYLEHQGWLLLEHGYLQGSYVRDLFIKRGFLKVQTFTDLENRERVTKGYFI